MSSLNGVSVDKQEKLSKIELYSSQHAEAKAAGKEESAR